MSAKNNENKPKKITKRRPRTKPGELPPILPTKHGSAYMNYRGQKHFLGTYGSEEAERRRRQIIAEYEAGHKILPSRAEPTTVAMLVVRFLDQAKRRYVKNGRDTLTYDRFRYTSGPLLQLYAATPVMEFRPLALKAVRQTMIESGKYCRRIVNQRIGCIKQMFRWGVAEELVPPETVTALEAVAGLRKGEIPGLRETPPVKMVKKAVIARTLPLLPPAIAAMVQIQQHTGMRPGETVAMRPCDIYRQGDELPEGYEMLPDLKGCWIYIPEEHKTEHHNQIRFVILNQTCQRLLTPFLTKREHGEYLFSPAAEAEERRARQRAARKTPIQPSQQHRKKENPERTPGKKYTANSYRSGIQKQIKKFNSKLPEGAEKIPKWFPNQLRHLKATEIRRDFGVEAARVVLNHARLSTTELYAEKTMEDAVKIAVLTDE